MGKYIKVTGIYQNGQKYEALVAEEDYASYSPGDCVSDGARLDLDSLKTEEVAAPPKSVIQPIPSGIDE